MFNSHRAVLADELASWVCDARQRTLELVSDLNDDQLMGPQLPSVNPLLWEIGHAAWFQDHWVLQRVAHREPLRVGLDKLYDSITIPHEIRWDLPLLSRNNVVKYICDVRDRVLELLSSNCLTDELVGFVKWSVFHEDMHTEAFTHSRQILGYPPPQFSAAAPTDQRPHPSGIESTAVDSVSNDVQVLGGTFLLGAFKDDCFVFDNEKWAHAVEVQPFRISRTAVTQKEFAVFIDDDGYGREELWSEVGWKWREQVRAHNPVYWRKDARGNWLRRDFDQWVPLEPHYAVVHVNWYEVQAYCRWANRRLPTEVEWECAAAGIINDRNEFSAEKRRYPWGDNVPTPDFSNLDWRHMGATHVAALPGGDSELGCRQMIGNVWEWTSTDFQPYPGFVADFYKEYSTCGFGNCKVLRGGCWASRSRLIRNTWRNYYRPDRRDVGCGFRTCARET